MIIDKDLLHEIEDETKRMNTINRTKAINDVKLMTEIALEVSKDVDDLDMCHALKRLFRSINYLMYIEKLL